MAIYHRSYGGRLLDCAPQPFPISNALRTILGIREADCQLPGFIAKGASAGVDHMRCLVFFGAVQPSWTASKFRAVIATVSNTSKETTLG